MDREIENLETEDIFDKWRTLEFNLDEKYQYLPKSIIFKICSNTLYYIIAFPILKLLTKILYNFKIEGKENLQNLKKGGITVSNHVLVLDCAMIGLAYETKKVYYTTLQSQFKIPIVRRIIKLLRAIPIPTEISNKKVFLDVIRQILQEEQYVHFYPEGKLFKYAESMHEFQDGAFSIAIKNGVPIIPMVFKFTEPNGIRKIFKKNKDVVLKILSPIDTTGYENNKNDVKKLKEQVLEQMKQCI